MELTQNNLQAHFSDLGNSIFDRPQGPLADATLKRIAKGIQKYVIETKEPFFVNSATPFMDLVYFS
ncbi:hypothetical protein [Acinetobacter baumannii]|uniref:hypothetical protein n=1 Tax=Acinetobacter baumannii TaxID=470 RepID=UPI001EDABBDF|nr:hypothetical protein [Acinetobacter baumannii]